MSVAIRSRAAQDRRHISRTIVCMDCELIYEGATHKAVMVDLSLKGAFFSASFLPPKDSRITVTLNSPATQKPLVFEGTVIRGTWAMTDCGKRSRFGISFRYAPAGLIALMTTANK